MRSHAPQVESSPDLLQLEKAQEQQRRLSTAKNKIKNKLMKSREFPGRPVVSTHCQGSGFSPWLGIEESTSQQPGENQTNERQRNDDSWSQDDGYLALEEGLVMGGWGGISGAGTVLLIWVMMTRVLKNHDLIYPLIWLCKVLVTACGTFQFQHATS